MDDELRLLARAHEKDPTDPEVARRYDAALLRKGEVERVHERYRVKFICPLRWADLETTSNERVRYCEKCERPVFAVTRVDELRQRVRAGECVAILDRRVLESVDGLIADPAIDSARAEKPPCMVERRLLDAPIPPDVRYAIDPVVARTHRVVPLRWKGESLTVASDRELDLPARDELRRALGADVDAVLVSTAELDEALARYYASEDGIELLGALG